MTVSAVAADRRQLILGRLFDILSNLTIGLTSTTIVPGNIVHNRNELPAEKVPGLILLDADEVWDPRTPDLGQRGTAQTPIGLVRMTPEVYVVLDTRKISDQTKGEDLNIARAIIIGKVITDATLKQIIGGNGQIKYDGCVTDLARNRVMQGQMGLSFTFVYPFVPTEFAESTT